LPPTGLGRITVARLSLATDGRGWRHFRVLTGAFTLGLAAIAVPIVETAATVTAPVSSTAAAASIARPHPGSGIVPAGLDDFECESYEADFFLDRDRNGRSLLRSVETFVAVFPADQNRGTRHAIPDYYRGVSVEVSNISVTDETGAPRPFSVETD
jgi:hypothetical protein